MIGDHVRLSQAASNRSQPRVQSTLTDRPADPRTAAIAALAAKVARCPAPDQSRIVMGVADLYADQSQAQAQRDRLASVFVELVRTVESEVRRALSERIGSADWLPRDLAVMLANDEIEIARPVITASPLLNDEDLLALLSKASIDHRLQVALRPGISATVSDAIIQSDEPLLMSALANNTLACLPDDGLERLISAAERVVGLRQPLTTHPLLTEKLAEPLYAWVGDALQVELCARFPAHAEQLKAALRDSVQLAQDARVAMKLHDTGRLNPATLLRFLRERRQGLFLQSLCLLAEIRTDELDDLIHRPSARHLYLVCLAAGLERAVFPDVLEGMRRLGISVPPPLLDTELRLGERDRYQAKLELRAVIDSLTHSRLAH